MYEDNSAVKELEFYDDDGSRITDPEMLRTLEDARELFGDRIRRARERGEEVPTAKTLRAMAEAQRFIEAWKKMMED